MPAEVQMTIEEQRIKNQYDKLIERRVAHVFSSNFWHHYAVIENGEYGVSGCWWCKKRLPE